jgi:hypothetical protein
MRFGLRILFMAVAVASAGAACSLFSNADDLSGEVPVAPEAASLEESGAMDASSEEAEETASGDAVDAGCAEPDLVGRWDFDEGEGTVARDCSGLGNDGLLMADAGWTDGVHGHALKLDGAGWVGLPNTPSLQIEGSFTAAAYIRVTSFPDAIAQSTYIVGKTAEPHVTGWRIGAESASQLSFLGFTSSGQALVYSPAVSANVWVHVATVFQPGAVLIYVNGFPAGLTSLDAGATIINSAAEPRIGARADDSSIFYGDIDEVRIYRRALAADEIAKLAGK